MQIFVNQMSLLLFVGVAVRECTEMLFPPDENLKWTEIKKSIDEKCKMVRNNRCFVWAGVKHLQGLKKRKYLHANRIFMLLPPIVYFLLLWGPGIKVPVLHFANYLRRWPFVSQHYC